jgi:hypothetical protein
MAIPRRLIAVAVSAVAAGAVLYVSSRLRRAPPRRSAVDESNDDKERAARDEERRRAEQARRKDSESSSSSSSPSSSSSSSSSSPPASGTSSEPAAASASPASATSTPGGAQKELALFLAGDAWHDEIGWQALWEKEGVASPPEWLRSRGREVLVAERRKLVEHPALLAGCRRRWIVVCRYAGIDVGDAATLWNQSESA